LLNEKRTEITKIELKQRVTVLLVPNKNLDTPNYRLERLRHDDPRLENLQASYTMIEEASEETGVTRREKTAPKQEPVVKGIMPETPAPAPVPRPAAPPVASVAVPAPAPAATGGFFGWLGRLFGGGEAAPAAAPVAVAAPLPSPTEAGRGDRNGRGGRGGRGGRDSKRPERIGETRPEGRGGERRDARPGRGARTDEMAATDTSVVREERPVRSDVTAEAGDENRRSRGGRGGRGRGDRAEREVRSGEPVVDENGLPVPDVDIDGNLTAPAIEGAEQTAEGAEGSESGEGKTRRRRRGGRGGRDRNAARPVDGDGELAADLPVTGDDEGEVQTASPAEAGEAVERDGRRRGGRGRGRGDRGEVRTDGEVAADSAAESVVSSLNKQASDSGTIEALRPATSIVAAEVVDAVAEFIPAQAAPVEQAVPEAPAIVAQPAVVAVAEPVVQQAPAPAVIEAPAVGEPVLASAAAPFILETTALAAVAESAGLQWVNSDADKMRSAQEAMANEPKPVHVPRAIKPAAVIDEGPLMLVETRKDLSQVTLPFESEADKPSA
jgi:ribonuclease E